MLENRQGEYFIETNKKCVFVICSERIYLSCLCVLNVLFIHLNTKIWFTRQIHAEWTELYLAILNTLQWTQFFLWMNFTNGNGNKAQFSKYYKIVYVYKSKQNGIQKKILTEMSTTTIKRILIIRLKLTKMPITTTTTNNQNMKNTSLNTRTKNKN